MSLKGSFNLYAPERLKGHVSQWQFVLSNTNMLFSETVDVMLRDCYGQQPFYFRNVKIGVGKSIAFNSDTVDWEWFQDDIAAIIDSNNNILKQWQFHIPEYKPGECPECHGTLKCAGCHGQGTLFKNGHVWEAMSRCKRCSGSGTCKTCHIPLRKPKFNINEIFNQRNNAPLQPSYAGIETSGNYSSNVNRQCDILRQRISELQDKIHRIEWDMRMMELKGMNVDNYSVYTSYNTQLYSYRKNLSVLQSQLDKLMGF